MSYKSAKESPSKTRAKSCKALWDNPEWREKALAARRKTLAKAWTPERRRRQSEWAKSLNKTMSKEMRKANGEKIAAQAIERYKDPKKRAMHQQSHYHTAANKRTHDLQKAREIVEPWGLYVDDSTNQEQLDEIIEIFGM